MRMPVTTQLWSHEQVAAWLNVGENALMRLVASGTGPVCYWVGSERRYDPAEVAEWLSATPEDFYWPTATPGANGTGRHAA